MKGVNIHNLEIVIKGHIDINKVNVNLGSLTLSADGREYILDVDKSYTDHTEDLLGDDITRITCDLEVDKETFNECKYDFTKEDLLNADCYEDIMEMYIDGDDFELESVTLHFDCDGQDYQLKTNNV
jgi:hypothetical protein